MTMKTITMRRLAAATLLASSLALGACGGSMPNPGMASAKAPLVTQTILVHDLGYAGSDGLSGEQRKSLSEWFDGIGVRYGDRVSVDDQGSGSGVRRAAIASVLAEYGLLLSEQVPVTPGAGNAGARVVVMRAAATVPGCPDWTRGSNAEFEASTMSNYGCASESNLAAMVVDANDLVSGKAHTGTDALTTVKAIETYRGKAAEGTDKVKSTVGTAGSN
ncbi:CpaD family pilus assembly protein [Sphingosinicella soli]|uniref:Pilus assembly protein CpaD n=1 Tax=Sphingosinicella soli TaxID=333708 RepID=A0A7W7AZ21_9SPHN|nr:CpaD family pilus assembly lipoprotein [Sphingosinicella soli]MBB4631001.1 pilus assembly protein CpaD [Sphingosinicella soli]